jgi:pullulanase/glycogen debranching enzyme
MADLKGGDRGHGELCGSGRQSRGADGDGLGGKSTGAIVLGGHELSQAQGSNNSYCNDLSWLGSTGRDDEQKEFLEFVRKAIRVLRTIFH